MIAKIKIDKSKSCSTKYPIIFIHGTGVRHNDFLNFWGRIPKALTDRGATIFYARSDAFGTLEANAESIKEYILEVIGDSEKVNLIAHSRGGLEGRYLISKLGMAEKVASLSTISTPHRGSKTLEIFRKFPGFIIHAAAFFVNFYYRIFGDKKPDFFTFVKQISSSECEKFNAEVIDVPQVYYQSYAMKMKNAFSDILLFFPYLVLKAVEGDNDGIVAVNSAAWGDFHGVITGKKNRGVSHVDSVDLRRTDSSGFDIRKTYIELVERLVSKGL
ncbi:MAG: hypothetical protein WCQ41_05545 [Bacillota bacterium]